MSAQTKSDAGAWTLGSFLHEGITLLTCFGYGLDARRYGMSRLGDMGEVLVVANLVSVFYALGADRASPFGSPLLAGPLWYL